MKKFLSLSVLLVAMLSLQGCVSYVYGPVGYGPVYGPGPVVGWHHWHHGWWDAPVTTPAQSATLLTQNYGISPSSALTIADFAAGVNSAQILKTMGVSASDLAPLSDYQMPSQQTIQNVATNLNEDSTKIEKIFSDFVTDAKADSDDAGN